MHIIPGGTLIAETVTAPLYPDARVSTDACQIMLRSYICRHHPSKQAQSDLLGFTPDTSSAVFYHSTQVTVPVR